MLERQIVVLKSIEVKHVLGQLILRILSLLKRTLILACLGLLLKLIALVVPPSRIGVLLPGLKTQPAELVRAPGAGHMVTPLVLLNGLTALRIGAWLRVGDHPGDVLTLIAVLHLPLLRQLTRARPMGVDAAPEAELVPALALDFFESQVFGLDAVLAAGARAPSDALVVVGEALAVEFHVLAEGEGVGGEDAFPEGVLDLEGAADHGAGGLQAGFALGEFGFEVLAPTGPAEGVAAGHAEVLRVFPAD